MRGGGSGSPKMSKNYLNTILNLINYNLDPIVTKKSSTPPIRYLQEENKREELAAIIHSSPEV